MATSQITIPITGAINASIQKGDMVYYSSLGTVPNSGFNIASNGNIIQFGVVTAIDSISITVAYDVAIPVPSTGDYIMFEKNSQVNSSSIKGYYASVKFINKRGGKIELFSIGSEVSESSK